MQICFYCLFIYILPLERVEGWEHHYIFVLFSIHDLDVRRHMSRSFVFSGFSSKELFFLLILMELWTITVGALFSLYKHTFHNTGQTGCQVIRGLVTTTIAYDCCPLLMIPSQFIPVIVSYPYAPSQSV